MDGIEPNDLVGQSMPQNGTMEFVLGRASTAVKYGAVLAFDEPFKVSPAVSMCFQWLYERDDPALLLWGHHDPEQVMLKTHPEFRVFLCDNVRGVGDGMEHYAATQIQDVSTINRMSTRLFLDYMKPEEEEDIILQKYPLLSERLVKSMVGFGNMVRSAWRNGALEIPWSIRDLDNWARKILQYNDVRMALVDCYAGYCSEEQKPALSGWFADVGLQAECGVLFADYDGLQAV